MMHTWILRWLSTALAAGAFCLAHTDLVTVQVVSAFQPQREIVERWQGAARLRLGIAEGEYRRLAATRFAAAADLRQARRRADAIVLETRRGAAAEVAREIRSDQDLLETKLTGLGARNMRRLWLSNSIVAEIPAGALRALETDPAVAEVTLVETRQVELERSAPALGSLAFWGEGLEGEGEAVAILDSGIRSEHPAFAGKEVSTAVFLENARRSGDPCWDDDASTTADRQGHGTHVAGIAAGSGFPAGPLLFGVARGLSAIYSAKVAYKLKPDGKYVWQEQERSCNGSASLNDADVLEGLQWVLTETPARVINYSAGGLPLVVSQGKAVRLDDTKQARDFDRIADLYDVSIVVAAGNAGQLGEKSVGTPGIGYNVITVANWDASVDADRAAAAISRTSSRGPTELGRFKPDLAAPGEKIRAAAHDSDGAAEKSGTSMAAPHIAGAVAILRQAGIESPMAAKALLINSASNTGWRSDRGWGFADLRRAFEWKDLVAEGTIGPAGPEGLLLLGGETSGPFKATLVWNRHIYTSDSYFHPMEFALYSRTGTRPFAESTSTRQNVHQVMAEGPAEFVMKIKSTARRFDAGIREERFALAMSENPGLRMYRGPQLDIRCSNPGVVLAKTSFSIECAVTNTGDLGAPLAAASLLVPEGFTRPNTAADFGYLAPGQRTIRTLTATSGAAPGAHTVRVAASSRAFGEEFTAQAVLDLRVAAPEIRFSPRTMTFTLRGGTTSAPDTLTITSTGEPMECSLREMDLAARAPSYNALIPLLVLSKAKLTVPGSVQVAARVGGSRAESSPRTVTSHAVEITCPASPNSPQRMPVTVNVVR